MASVRGIGVFAILADEYAKSRGFDVKKCLELIEQAHK